MNAFGGEDRLWLGPEGGQYSIFFRKGDPFDLEHWQTPPLIDSEPWPVAEQGPRHVVFRREGRLVNYSGTTFELPASIEPSGSWSATARHGCSACRSRRSSSWSPSSPRTSSSTPAWPPGRSRAACCRSGSWECSSRRRARPWWFPYREGPESELGPVVNDAYFGKVPADRLAGAGRPALLQGRRRVPQQDRPLARARDRARGQLRRRARSTDDRQLHTPGGHQRLRQLDVGDPEGAVPRRRRQQLQRRPARRRAASRSAPSTSSRPPRPRRRSRRAVASPTCTGRSTSRASEPFSMRSHGRCSAFRSTMSSRRFRVPPPADARLSGAAAPTATSPSFVPPELAARAVGLAPGVAPQVDVHLVDRSAWACAPRARGTAGTPCAARSGTSRRRSRGRASGCCRGRARSRSAASGRSRSDPRGGSGRRGCARASRCRR